MKIRKVAIIAFFVFVALFNFSLLYIGTNDFFLTLKQNDILETKFINKISFSLNSDSGNYYKKIAQMEIVDSLKKPKKESIKRGIRTIIYAINRNPGDEENWLILAELLQLADKINKKESLFSIDDLDSDDKSELRELSLRCLIKANKLNPGAKEIVFHIADLLFRLDRKDEALKYVEQYFFLSPSFSWNNIPFNKNDEKVLEAALVGLNRYINANHGERRRIFWKFHPYSNSVAILYRLGRKDKIAELVQKGLKASPEYMKARYWYEMGRMFESFGEYNSALKYYQNALAIDPEMQNTQKKIEKMEKVMDELKSSTAPLS